jgi:hypothetical protein
MNRKAPRSIDQYLKALREELAGEDAAQDPQRRGRRIFRPVPVRGAGRASY